MFSACCKTHCISWPRNCPCPLPINPTDHLPTVAGRGDVAIKCPPSTVSTCYQKRHGHDESCSGELSGVRVCVFFIVPSYCKTVHPVLRLCAETFRKGAQHPSYVPHVINR
uniref:Uncharacterized protein n=1 Tax=Anopheles dirus TaxID=7168 RepID=A0A182NWZ8_9DIPT